MIFYGVSCFRRGWIAAVVATAVSAQVFVDPPKPNAPKPAAQQPARTAAPGAAQTPAAPAQGPAAAPAKPPAQGPATVTPPSAIALPARGPGGFNFRNASLVEVIELMARLLKINYILDPRVKGSVTISTFGEMKSTDLLPLLQTILRINGAGMVQVGELYRIVPLNDVSSLPISPSVDSKDLPEDERIILNLIFLKYATVSDLSKLLQPFLGESAKMTSYDPANLLLILDNSRNMRRTLELVALFDSDSFAGQRVRLFEVTHARPSEVVRELDTVFKAYALSEKSSPIKFMPIDRLNTLLAVAPNPGIFAEVEKWIQKLDVRSKVTAGSTTNYVYRLKYSRAEIVGMAVMSLYSGFPMGMMGGMGMGGMGYGGMGGGGMGYGGMGGGGMGGGGMGYGGMGGGGMGYGGMGVGGMGYGGMGVGGMGYGGMGGGGMGYGGMGYGGMNYGGMPYANAAAQQGVTATGGVTTAPTTAGTTPTGTTAAGDLTGSYLGSPLGFAMNYHPRIIPNPFDNTLLIQGTPQEWEEIKQLIEQIDIPPRQVLIEAKVYEVELTGVFSQGVQSFLQARSANGTATNTSSTGTSSTASRFFQGTNSVANGLTLTAGLLVGHSRELLGILTANETTTKVKVISAPSVIATDSIPASINVGQDVPTLASQAVSGAQVGGTSLFANTISNRSTGVGLNIMARVNSSGIVTMVINQQVSSPQAPAANASIQSPSFQQRTVQTQVTVQDGDTVSIGGIIEETDTSSSGGVPYLHRIPILGGAFGGKNSNKARTELVVFLTPRVIYDTNEMVEASDELKGKLKRLQRMIKE